MANQSKSVVRIGGGGEGPGLPGGGRGLEGGALGGHLRHERIPRRDHLSLPRLHLPHHPLPLRLQRRLVLRQLLLVPLFLGKLLLEILLEILLEMLLETSLKSSLKPSLRSPTEMYALPATEAFVWLLSGIKNNFLTVARFKVR